jgi:hypothetical protein
MFKIKHVIMSYLKMVLYICLVSNTFATNRAGQHRDLDSPHPRVFWSAGHAP